RRSWVFLQQIASPNPLGCRSGAITTARIRPSPPQLNRYHPPLTAYDLLHDAPTLQSTAIAWPTVVGSTESITVCLTPDQSFPYMAYSMRPFELAKTHY